MLTGCVTRVERVCCERVDRVCYECRQTESIPSIGVILAGGI